MLYCLVPLYTGRPEQDVVAADDESSFTFDVDGLSDEALDPRPRVGVMLACVARALAMLSSHRGPQGAARRWQRCEIPFDAQIMARCGAGSQNQFRSRPGHDSG